MFVDRLVMKDGIRQRLTDSVELAPKLAEGVVKVSPLGGASDLLFSEKFACITCGISYPEITPRLFSFNNPAGACPACDGIGAKMFFDPDLIVPDEDLSLREGAIEPWERRNSAFFQQILEAVCNHFEIDHVHALEQAARRSTGSCILEGSGGEEVDFSFEKNGAQHSFKKEFEGVLANLRAPLRRVRAAPPRAGDAAARRTSRRSTTSSTATCPRSPCEECGGTRLRKEARFVKVGGKQHHRDDRADHPRRARLLRRR